MVRKLHIQNLRKTIEDGVILVYVVCSMCHYYFLNVKSCSLYPKLMETCSVVHTCLEIHCIQICTKSGLAGHLVEVIASFSALTLLVRHGLLIPCL